MKTYRVYCFDGIHRIIASETIEAQSDIEAMAAAKQVRDCLHYELWDRDRLVGRIDPD